MVRYYYLQNDAAPVTLQATVTAIGIASTVVQRKRSGGAVIPVPVQQDASGSIQPVILGPSADLLQSTLVINTVINLVNVDPYLWDHAFENAKITYTLQGGLDGEQVFEYDMDDKFRTEDHKIIIISKPIKLAGHAV